jgi:predicted TPR repeat methyltransferase
MNRETRKDGLAGAYDLASPQEAREHYDAWAQGYDAEVAANAYITPERCAGALAGFATDRAAPLADFGCGTGLSGEALAAAGFTAIDGFDLSEEMLAEARGKGVYRDLATADLSQPLPIADGAYANAAAIGVITPTLMPVTVLDEILRILAPGGCFVFSVNDHAAEDGTLRGRIMELTDCGYAELLFAEHGPHLPEIGLEATVYVLRRR